MPAQAADSLRVGLNSSVEELITGPDGGAWVQYRANFKARVARLTPEGAVRVVRTDWLQRGALGPDGRAWFNAGDRILRVDGDGATSTLPLQRISGQLATGPDGTTWMSGPEPARIAPDGTVTPLTLDVPGCPEFSAFAIVRAADDAMWFEDFDCGWVRLPPGGPPTLVAKSELPAAKAVADRAGGVWFAHHVGPGGGHVDATGKITMLKNDSPFGMQDVAVAPDGTAWFATGECTLARASADGTLNHVRTPIPSWHVGFDPGGGLWLGSLARVQHTTLGAPAAGCDDTPPRVRVTPDPGKRIDLAQLRRQRGFKLTVPEPFQVEGYVFDADADETIAGVLKAVQSRKGRTIRLPISPRILRRMERHRGQPLGLSATVRDREGNVASVDFELRFRAR